MSYLVVGLGNPDEEYSNTRHNVGRMVVDALLEEGTWERSTGTKALYAKTRLGKALVELLKPEAYMNRSGAAVSYAVKKHAVSPEHVIVVHDDVDLPFGTIKVSFGRGSGGHRGVESIIRSLGTKDFIRVRVGVVPTTLTGKLKKPQGEQRVHDFLLGDFTAKEKKALSRIKKDAASAIEMIISEGKERAMNKFN